MHLKLVKRLGCHATKKTTGAHDRTGHKGFDDDRNAQKNELICRHSAFMNTKDIDKNSHCCTLLCPYL